MVVTSLRHLDGDILRLLVAVLFYRLVFLLQIGKHGRFRPHRDAWPQFQRRREQALLYPGPNGGLCSGDHGRDGRVCLWFANEVRHTQIARLHVFVSFVRLGLFCTRKRYRDIRRGTRGVNYCLFYSGDFIVADFFPVSSQELPPRRDIISS